MNPATPESPDDLDLAPVGTAFQKEAWRLLSTIPYGETRSYGEQAAVLGRPNAVLYPHLASRTDRALRAMSWVVRDVVAVLEGRVPRYPAPATE